MAIRNIRVKGDPILKLKSRRVERFDGRLCTLLDDMRETMYRADGCGLAAVQVGVLKRVVVIDVGDGPIELINPEIVEMCVNSKGRIFWQERFATRSTI